MPAVSGRWREVSGVGWKATGTDLHFAVKTTAPMTNRQNPAIRRTKRRRKNLRADGSRIAIRSFSTVDLGRDDERGDEDDGVRQVDQEIRQRADSMQMREHISHHVDSISHTQKVEVNARGLGGNESADQRQRS